MEEPGTANQEWGRFGRDVLEWLPHGRDIRCRKRPKPERQISVQQKEEIYND